MKHIKTLVGGKACVTMVGLFDMVDKKSAMMAKKERKCLIEK